VDKSLKSFLSNKGAENTEVKEWCATEKNSYFDYMRGNFRTEYDNIIRLES
jgi:hypothetical protein